MQMSIHTGFTLPSQPKEVLVAQSCPTPCNPTDRSLPGSSLHGIFQARILEWVAISTEGTIFLVLFINMYQHCSHSRCVIVAEWKNVFQHIFSNVFIIIQKDKHCAITPLRIHFNPSSLGICAGNDGTKARWNQNSEIQEKLYSKSISQNFFYNIFRGLTGGNLYYSACEKDFHTSVYRHPSSSVILINLMNI